MEPVIEVRDLVKQYPGVRAVDGVSFTIAPGTCFGLLGPNGAGKTTTVEIMEGVTPLTSGQVLYRGQPLGERFRAEAGIQFQKTALQEFVTVRETLAMFRRLDESAWRRLGTASGKPVSVRALAFIMAGHVAHHFGVLEHRYGLAHA